MTHLCLHADIVAFHPDLIKDVDREQLHFPQNVPESTLIRTARSTRAAFIEIFHKYIGSRATWKVRLDSEIQEEILQSYRRLDSQKRRSFFASPRGHFASSSLPLELGEASKAINAMRGPHCRRTMLKSLVDTANRIMKEVIKRLEASFEVYRETAVKHVLSCLLDCDL